MIDHALPSSFPVVRVSPAGQAFATSADVGSYFGKRHDNVVRAIERLLADLSSFTEHESDKSSEGSTGEGELESLAEGRALDDQEPRIGLTGAARLFEPTLLETRAGKGAARTVPGYNLSRDGFALLAMGFTGKRALAFKLRYITAFNSMEAKLNSLHVVPFAEDLRFAEGLKFKTKVMLQEKAFSTIRTIKLSKCEDERRQAYWHLHQINASLGVPMPSMQAMGVIPLSADAAVRARVGI